MSDVRKLRRYVGPDGDAVCVYRVSGGWQSEVRAYGDAGRVIGLVWQSGYYLTRRGATRAVRLYLHTGSDYAETLGYLAGWRARLTRLPRLVTS